MEPKILTFNLSEEFEYSKDGGFTKTASLEFAAPSMECFQAASDFQQLVARAFMGAAKGGSDQGQEPDPKDAGKTPKAKEINVILNASDSVKFSEIATAFKTLAIEIGTFDGVTAIKDDHFGKMQINDFSMMICEYIATFTFPSLFAEL